jgi:hypothetical protein
MEREIYINDGFNNLTDFVLLVQYMMLNGEQESLDQHLVKLVKNYSEDSETANIDVSKVIILIDYGADFHAKDEHGRTIKDYLNADNRMLYELINDTYF